MDELNNKKATASFRHPLSNRRMSVRITKALLISLVGFAVIYFLPRLDLLGLFSKNNIEPAVLPVGISIPKIGVQADIISLDLQADKNMEVPQDTSKVGWYIYSPIPGQVGPSVLVGHLDSSYGPAVFARLKELKPGDDLSVTKGDGKEVLFVVTNSAEYSQEDFPSELVYGPTEDRALRLITCSGRYSLFGGRYSHNLVVYAKIRQ